MNLRVGSQRLGLPARLAIVAGALGFAALALGDGLDRAAVGRHDLIAMVPEAFRARSLDAAGAEAVKAGHYGEALKLGEEAVARAPMEASSTALLGLGRLMARDEIGAQQAFLVAGTRGWRIPITQTYWMQIAYQLGDYPVAAMRLDALLRQQPYQVRQNELLAPFESNPEAGAALIERMLTRPNWLGMYARHVGNLAASQIAGRRVMMEALARRGMVLGCDQIGSLTGELVRYGDVGGARAVWGQHCPAAGRGLVADSALDATVNSDAPSAPFAWRLFGSGDLRVVPHRALEGQGQWLEVSNDSPLIAPVMRQMVVAPAGRYRLSWLARDGQGKGSQAVEPYLGCDVNNLERTEPGRDTGLGRWQADIEIDGKCAGHWLQFTLKPGAEAVQLGAVTLTPLGH